MTIFNGAIAAKSIEDWDDLAKESVESSGGHPGLLGILGLGAGVLLAGLSPIAVLGLIPAAWGIKKAMEVNDRRSRMDAALDMGAYAAVLPQQALREYAQQFGMEQAIAQIDWAKRAGVPLSEAAETLLGRYKQKYKALPPALEPIAALEPQAVSTATQLGAIDTTAVEVDDALVDEWWADGDGATPLISGDRPQSTEPKDDEYAWAKDLIHFPAVLVYGQQGSGKTSFTTWLLRERIKAGHEAEVWDVHRAFGQWKGLPVHGDGMDYEAVDARMGTFTRLVKDRYRKLSTVEGYKPSWKTAICEEFTNFDGQCQNSPTFFKKSLSDFRKVKLCVIYCGHGRTLSSLGGAKGCAEMRDSGLIELELEAKIDPVTRELVSAQKGRLKLPNQAPITVKIADWMRGTSDFSDIVQVASPVDEVAIASVSDEEEAPHKGTVEKRNQGNEAILKVRAKVAKKFKTLEGEWAPIGSVSTSLFNNKEDRELAKRLIEVWINNGTLNSEDRAMPNGATVLFVRVNPERLTNKK